MALLKSILPSHVHIVENIQCNGNEHLKDYLSSVVAASGEGLMLRSPQTLQQQGYTSSLLKVKVNILFLSPTFI